MFRPALRRRIMKKSMCISSVLAVVAVMGMMFFHAGCEDSPSNDGIDDFFDSHPFVSDPRVATLGDASLTLSPASASIDVAGQKVAFRVSGGEEAGGYTWEVANSSAGTITRSSSATYSAVYTATIVAPNTIIVYDANGKAGIADITLGSSAEGFQIMPGDMDTTIACETTNTAGFVAARTAINGSNIVLQAIGGVPPYGTFYAGSSAHGIVAAGAANDLAVYTYSGQAMGENKIWVTDSSGAKAEMTVTILFSDEN